MDPVINAALLGAIFGTTIVLSGLLVAGGFRGKRGAAPKKKVDQSAWEPMFGRAHGDWYRWFAWRPVRTLDRGLVWLRPVWRRRVYKHSYLPGPSTSWYQNLVELKYIFD